VAIRAVQRKTGFQRAKELDDLSIAPLAERLIRDGQRLGLHYYPTGNGLRTGLPQNSPIPRALEPMAPQVVPLNGSRDGHLLSNIVREGLSIAVAATPFGSAMEVAPARGTS
jgi:hypothetical protein